MIQLPRPLMRPKKRGRWRSANRREWLARRVWATTLGACVAITAVCGWHAYYNIPLNRWSAISKTLAGARLNPLPTSAIHLVIRKNGSMFSHRFILTFQAMPAEIEEWLLRSPGTAITEPVTSDDSRRYIIEPMDGRPQAEVIVSNSGQSVRILADLS